MENELLEVEYNKCILQPAYAIEAYFQLYDNETHTGIPFKLTENQKRFVNCLEMYSFNIVKTTRLIGSTSIIVACVASKLAFNKGETPEFITYISPNKNQSDYFMSEVMYFLTNIPRWVWGEEYFNDSNKSIFIRRTDKDFILPNGARLKVCSSNPDDFRGYKPTHIIMDNAAFIINGFDIYKAIMSRLDIGGKITIISTPNGNDKFFKKIYNDAMLFENNFNIVDLNWVYDFRFNQDLIWTKNDEEVAEQEFTHKSISRMLYNGWKPSSTWYRKMCSYTHNMPDYNDQEFNGMFL